MFEIKYLRLVGVFALAVVLFATGGLASISLTTPTGCVSVYPGDSVTKAVRVSVDESGTYNIQVTGDIDVRPGSWVGYVVEDDPKYVYFTIRAPVDVVDDYFSVTFTLYDADNQYVDDTTMCIHVSRYGEAAASVTNFAFGAKEYYEEGGYVVIPLYVRNTGSVDTTVEFLSNFSDVRFTKTAVFVRAGGEAEVLAKVPGTDDLPSSITFYAYGNGIRKEVKVRFTSDTAEQVIGVQMPDEVTLNKGITYVPLKITNHGDTRIVVTPKLKDAPFGINSYAEPVSLYPRQTATVNMIVKARDVLQTGQRVAKLCLLDDAQVSTLCKYLVLNIPAPETRESKVTVADGEKVVSITINNGAKDYDNVSVDVDTPRGWLVRVEPSDVLDIPAYETVDLNVYFMPSNGAEDGLATVLVRSPDGTILAKRTVDLSRSELTGFGVLGDVSPAWAIVGLIVLAVLFALFSKGGSGSPDTKGIEQLKAEITKK